MTNKKAKMFQRLLAAFMSLLMVLSVIPFSTTITLAATADLPDSVTITVKDEDGNFIKDASVNFTIESSTDNNKNIAETKITGDKGVVEILAADKFVADDLTLNATVTADGYFNGEIKDQAVESVDANYDVVLESTELKEVTIEGRNDLTYTGEAQDLVSIIPNNYTVTYKVNGGAESSEAKGTDATTYTIEVNVTDGVKTTNKTVTTEIKAADTGLDISKVEGLKYDDGSPMQLVEITSGELLDTDVVTWTVNGEDTNSHDIPTGFAVGSYEVKLIVDRGSNYEKFEKTVEVEIGLGEINLGDLKIESKDDLVYNGDEQELLNVTGKGDYTLEYSFDENESKTWTTWDNDNFPKKTDADTYYVYVKATKDKYDDMNTPAFPIAVTINQAEQTLVFDETQSESAEVTRAEFEVGKTFNFSATDEKNLANGTITYSVNIVEGDSDIASIDEDGLLTVNNAGTFEITATLSGNKNYADCSITHTIEINEVAKGPGELIKFANEKTEYIVGDKTGVPLNKASKTNKKDNGNITYSINEGDSYGLSIDKNGKITVFDYTKLISSINESKGTLNVTVRADKAEVKNSWQTQILYASNYDTYILTIKFLDTPENAYTLPKVDGENGWYKSEVTVTPATGYTIAKTEVNNDANNFDASVTFGDDKDQGTATRYVYLKNADGQITNAIPVNIKIDTIAPYERNMNIEIQKLSIIKKLGYEFGFFNPEVDIKLTVVDETDTVESGMQD